MKLSLYPSFSSARRTVSALIILFCFFAVFSCNGRCAHFGFFFGFFMEFFVFHVMSVLVDGHFGVSIRFYLHIWSGKWCHQLNFYTRLTSCNMTNNKLPLLKCFYIHVSPHCSFYNNYCTRNLLLSHTRELIMTYTVHRVIHLKCPTPQNLMNKNS